MYKLRELQKEDIPTINIWRNTRELIEYLGAPYRYINIDIEYKWYENYLNTRNNTIRSAIVMEGKEDEILGLVSLTNINRINQSAVFHIMIGDQNNRQKGIGFFATIEILKHAFKDMNLNRIELSVLKSNTRAIKLYEKVGFKEEGIKRKSVYKGGEFVDMIMMAILKEEFLKVRSLK
jgi:diamine N-acetyltransferase